MMQENQHPYRVSSEQVSSEEVSTRPKRRAGCFLLIAGYLLAGTIGALLFAVIGVIAGVYYGGNYASNYEFNGARGYEATGQLGALIGMVFGGLFIVLLFHLIVKQVRHHRAA